MIEVDAKRLLCPMPVIRLQDALEPLKLGEQVHIQCTDPGVLNDIPAWCRINGQSIIETIDNGDIFEFTVEKTAP